MIASMMSCDTREFGTADKFYEVIFRKIATTSLSFMTDSLEPKLAASGDSLEICKFYALFLEYMRKDHSGMLTRALEQASSENRVDTAVLLDMFLFFDNVYSESTADDWWACLRRDDEDQEASSGFRTPKRNNYSLTSLQTPTATARRLRTASSTARRSPIAEAVDSPTMKFMRSERELKQSKARIFGLEQMLGDLEDDKTKLSAENRTLKLSNSDLKSDIAKLKGIAEEAQFRAEELSCDLEAKKDEVHNILQQLNESRMTLRSEQRSLEEADIKKENLTAKLKTVTEDNGKLMKQARELRDLNDYEFARFRQQEQELTETLRATQDQMADLQEQLTGVEKIRASLKSENESLSASVEELSVASLRNKQDADNSKTMLSEELARFEETVDKLRQEKLEALSMANSRIDALRLEHSEREKMMKSTNARLQADLDEERNEKKRLMNLWNELNEKSLNVDKAVHKSNEEFQSMGSCLQNAKRQIEQLEVACKSKDDIIKFQEEQNKRAANLIKNEKAIRDQASAQFAEKLAILKNSLAEKENETVTLKENFASVVMKHKAELEEKELFLQSRVDLIQRLEHEVADLREKESAEIKKSTWMGERIKIFQQAPMRGSRIRCGSPDSLPDFLADNGPTITEEELRAQLATFPRKSIAPSVDDNEFDKGTPIGFKSNMYDGRESICSLDFFDRSSLQRSSMRSESIQLASPSSAGEFKQPFTPSGVTKERVGVLTARNEKVKPHLKCSYASEVGSTNSPSADEENIKKSKKKNRRDSIFSAFSSKKQ